MSKKTISLVALIAIGLSSTAPMAAQNKAMSTQFWWPEKLDLMPLRQHAAESNPYGDRFIYAQAFKTLDLESVKRDIQKALTTSQPWWPADYGNYGPFFVRMAWHGAGTYRTGDGRGGADGADQRFEPLNSWPDNVSLDKARRLLWPIKKKYGRKISWGDLMVLTGTVAMENMGFKTLGFAGGRTDNWEPDLVYWGPETKWLDGKRRNADGKLDDPLAAVQMGLIYVNPEGPNGVPDPLASAQNIREAFGRMAMNDEETVALIAGGHTFGKAHGAHKPGKCLGADPASASLEQQGLGWANKCGKGNAEDTITSGLEGAWSVNPIAWTTQYFDNLFAYEWIKTKSPAGAIQWMPKDEAVGDLVPDAHDSSKRHAPMMFTTDLALKFDPAYRKISQRFHDNPKEFELAFAKAWFKLTHRDMGPRARYLGADIPEQIFLWQDPISPVDHKLINDEDASKLKSSILASGVTLPELVRTAWASAASFRGTDHRGGANGARIRLEPQKSWAVNNPKELAKTLSTLEKIQTEFNQAQKGGKKISLADLIVLGGSAAIEKAASKAGFPIAVPFKPGRMDATQAQTDVKSFAALEPKADGFRNYYGDGTYGTPVDMLVDRANLLTLTVPEMTVLVGGMRVLNANRGQSDSGVFTNRQGTLSNDFFVNLLDMSTKWEKSSKTEGLYEGHDRKTGDLKWTATPIDLVFGSNAELRAVAEVYASDDAQEKFIRDFVAAWHKVMTLDRFTRP